MNPTCVRGTAIGLSSAGGRIGGAVSPLVFGLDNTFPWFSNTFFGVCGLLAGWATLSLPGLLQYLTVPLTVSRNERTADAPDDGGCKRRLPARSRAGSSFGRKENENGGIEVEKRAFLAACLYLLKLQKVKIV